MTTLICLLTISLNVSPQAFLRTPDVHDNQCVFRCEGDLWLGDISSGKATRLTRDEGTEARPHFSPDGKWIAFTAEYDGVREVYLMPNGGGAPKRLTYDGSYPTVLGWTPDSAKILYSVYSQVPGFITLHTVPVSGGASEKLPLEFGDTASFARDGNRFVFTRIPRASSAWFRYQGGQKNDIWVGNLRERRFQKIHSSSFTNEYPVWAGERIYFVKDEGDGSFSVVSVKPDGTDLKRISGPYEYEIRSLATDGKRLVYEKGIELEIVELATGKIAPLQFTLTSDALHTMPFLTAAEQFVQAARVGPTGKRALIEARGQIVSLPAKDGDARVLLAKEGVRFQECSFSPDGARLAYISDETREQQLYVSSADGTNPKQLTSDTGRQLRRAIWSPDGKWIALTDSEWRLRLIPAEGGEERFVAKNLRGGWEWPQFSFSPDSKWLLYPQIDQFTSIATLTLYEIATGKHTVISDGMHDDTTACFSSDGKWIAFITQRNIKPTWDSFLNQLYTNNPSVICLLALKKETKSPFLPESDEEPQPDKKADKPSEGADNKDQPAEKKPQQKQELKPEEKKPDETAIDLEGLYDRLVHLPVAPGNFTQIAMVGDRVIYSGDGAVRYYDIQTKSSGTVAQAAGFELSADNKKLLLHDGGASFRICDVTASDVKPGDGKLNYANLQLKVNPVKEWEQMYWDAWRLLRDYFYVRNMHGADWPALGDKYAKMLPLLRSRDELTQVIRWLQAELSTGHMYWAEGDNRTLQRRSSIGYLGVDLEPDPSGYLKIKKIFRGDGFETSAESPLAVPGLGVKEEDFLIDVAGVAAKPGSDYLLALANRAGQTVALRVNDKPSPDGARTIRIKPAGSEGEMRYREWVKMNREYVTKASDGRIAYIHLQAMGPGDMADFIKQYFPQRSKEALIIDDRFNGGGNISNNIITVLKQRVVAYFNLRNIAVPWSRQGEFFPGPMVCLMNEFSGSNGEEFPHHFRALKLGKIIGRRTWGGEVGSSPGWPLADGGIVNVPNYGAWNPEEGWIIEQKGLSPDIDVESDPNAYVLGKDPQLDKAVEVLLDELERNPVKRPQQPPDPVRAAPRKGKG